MYRPGMPRYTTVVAIAIVMVSAAWLLSAGTARAAGTSVNIDAGNWWFKPDTVTVQAGQPVTFNLTSSAGVHGIKSDELGIPQTVIMPGRSVSVTFTPKTAGTYKVYCSVPCGPGHDKQLFTVVVK